jgi:hypothetical protein
MTASDVRIRLSPTAVFRVVGSDEVEAIVDEVQHVLSMGEYRVALEFSSARAVGEVRSVARDLRIDDLEGLVERLTKQNVLSIDSAEDSDAPLQSILNAELFRDAKVLPAIGREIANGRAVVVAKAFDPDLAERVYSALERAPTWKPYEGQKLFFHFRQHNIFGWSNLPPEVRDCARILGSMQTKLLLSVLSGADCRGPFSVGGSMYLPGDYSLPHTDATDHRSIAYVWHLTKEWRPEWGGQFVWCPTGAIVNPSFNTLIAFKVTSASLHFVAPVSHQARGRRLSVNGWWTAPGPAPDEPEAPDLPWPMPLGPNRYGAQTAPLDGRPEVVVL